MCFYLTLKSFSSQDNISRPTRTSLCFAEACEAKRSGSISNTVYLEHLFAHLQGVRHAEDDPQHKPEYGSLDDFAASLRDLALHTQYERVNDIVPYIELFSCCFEGDRSGVEHAYNEIKRKPTLPDPIQPLVTLAIANSHADITRFCFDHGAVFDSHVDQAAINCLKTEIMLNTLISVNWMDLNNYTEAARTVGYRPENKAITLMRWKLKFSGGLEPGDPQRPRDGNFTLPVIRLVVTEVGIEAMRNTGTLQLASRLGDNDIVHFLLEAGVNIDDRPKPLDEREAWWPTTALREALFAHQFGTANILLNHDANIDEGTVLGYRDKGDNEVVEILERELEKRASFPLIRV